MAINKVEYKLNSSTDGFAVAGDEVTINKDNANTVQKDVDNGNTEKLNTFQQRFLTFSVKHSNDSVEYSGDGSVDDLDGKLFGNKIGNGENSTDEKLTTAATTFGALAGVGEAGAAMAMQTTAAGTAISGIGAAFGPQMETSTGEKIPIMDSFSATVIGGLDLGGGALAVTQAALFDSNYGTRLSNYSMSDETMSSINEQLELLNEDIETLSPLVKKDESEGEETSAAPAPEEGEGTAPTEGEGGADSEKSLSDQIFDLTQKLSECEANGDTEGADAIKAQLLTLVEGAEGGEETQEKEDPVAIAAKNGENATTAVEFGDSVASVLKEGKTMGALGTINSTALTACAVMSTILSVKAFAAITPMSAPNAAAGAAMCVAGSALFTASAVAMTAKTVKEFECGSRGSEVQDAVDGSQDTLTKHEELVESLQSQSSGEGEDSASGSSDTAAAVASATAAISTAPSTGSSSGAGASSGGSSSGGSSSGSSAA